MSNRTARVSAWSTLVYVLPDTIAKTPIAHVPTRRATIGEHSFI